jgi:hypothetical protein
MYSFLIDHSPGFVRPRQAPTYSQSSEILSRAAIGQMMIKGTAIVQLWRCVQRWHAAGPLSQTVFSSRLRSAIFPGLASSAYAVFCRRYHTLFSSMRSLCWRPRLSIREFIRLTNIPAGRKIETRISAREHRQILDSHARNRSAPLFEGWTLTCMVHIRLSHIITPSR